MAIEGYEPIDKLHITVAYIEEGFQNREEEIKELVINSLIELKAFEVKINKITTFPQLTEENKKIIALLINLPEEILKWREDLAETLKLNNFIVGEEYKYNPHITLAYVEQEKLVEENYQIPFETLSITSIGIWQQDRYDSIELNQE